VPFLVYVSREEARDAHLAALTAHTALRVETGDTDAPTVSNDDPHHSICDRLPFPRSRLRHLDTRQLHRPILFT